MGEPTISGISSAHAEFCQTCMIVTNPERYTAYKNYDMQTLREEKCVTCIFPSEKSHPFPSHYVTHDEYMLLYILSNGDSRRRGFPDLYVLRKEVGKEKK